MLVFTSMVFGLINALLFRRLVNRADVKRTVNRMLAHAMSFRLFADEPGLVFRAQLELLRENFRLLRQIAIPLIASAALLAASWDTMDRHFGYRPVPKGQTAVLTLPLGTGLRSSPEISVETPPVHIPRLKQVSWRVRVKRESSRVTERRAMLGLPWFAWFLAGSTVTAALMSRLQRSPGFFARWQPI